MQTPSKFILSDRHECLSLISCCDYPGTAGDHGRGLVRGFCKIRAFVPEEPILLVVFRTVPGFTLPRTFRKGSITGPRQGFNRVSMIAALTNDHISS
jgi:hypothetical protein